MGFRAFSFFSAFVLALCFFALGPRAASADTATVVRPGDTLISIAQRHRVTVADIVRVNGLASAERIYVGQHLRIPTDRRAPDVSSAGVSASSATSASARPSSPVRIDAPQSARGGQMGAAQAPSISSASAPAPAPALSASGAAQMTGQHVVGAGENLYRIALRYGTTAAELARANGLASIDRIYVGQRLRVPGGGADSGGAAGGSGSGAVTEAPQAAPTLAGPRVIVIDLSDQRLYAYQGYDLVQAFVVSTGSPMTPTPVGSFRVYNRLVSQDMYGPGYYAPGVPWVQYFTGAYAIHGTYWHDDFGVPVSHGCVNMRTPEAAWLFDWAQQGTEVRVQY